MQYYIPNTLKMGFLFLRNIQIPNITFANPYAKFFMRLNISTLKHLYLLEKEGKKLIYTLLEHAQLRTANTHVKTKRNKQKNS